MTTTLPPVLSGRLSLCGWFAAVALAATSLCAQTPAPRIQAEVSSSELSLVQNSQPFARPDLDAGRMPASTRLTGITLAFSRSAAQQADLTALLAAQQDPASPLFHQWLSPEQFAARFGMAQSDLDKVQTWLEQQGFAIDSVGRSRTMMRFSGTVGQVEQAFQTQMHYYNVGGVKQFAPSTVLSVPAAIAPVIESVRNLNNFKPHPMYIRRPRPNYTIWGTTSSGASEQVEFFAPGDIKVAYDMNSLISGGSNGDGQTIAIMGQSQISASDIQLFQSDAQIAANPQLTTILVPDTGNPQVSDGDETESDIDLEWAGAMAPGANIAFVYTGNSSTSNGIFDSISYAIDEKIGNILSISYGSCEALLSGFSIETTLQQAQAQGQTVLAASGDQGSTACSDPSDTNIPTATQQALSVNYPASSQYVTGVGGTEITATNDAAGTYWTSDGTTANSNILIESATQYIPEVAWNDDALAGTFSVAQGGGLSATGGGASTLFAQPSYQTSYFTATGEANPKSGSRLVPDVALYASPDYPGYVYCTSDPSAIAQGDSESCQNGLGEFFDAAGNFSAAGGTSFATPIFAGMVAILNQKLGYSDGQGSLNTNLYKLASNSTTYASAFHDVTTGNNDCTAGTQFGYCPANGATLGFATGTGYDEVTGLGSVDLGNLAGATGWPAASTLVATNTMVSAASASPTTGVSDSITITVASVTGSTTPTGTLTLSIDGGGTAYSNGGSTQSATLASNGTYIYTASFSTAGVHSIVAQYGGDATHAASTGAVSITVNAISSGKGTISLAASSLTVAQGSQGSSTITLTPAGGYTGTVYLSFDTSNDTALTNLCFGWGGSTTDGGNDGVLTVSGTAAVTTTLSFDTDPNDAQCSGAAVVKRSARGMHRLGSARTANNNTPTAPGTMPLTVAFAGLLLAGCLSRSSRKLRGLAVVIGLLGVGLALSACGGGNGSSTTVPDPPKGTYTVTVTGTDSNTATISATTTFTFTIN